MLITKLGEFGLIERFNKQIKLDKTVIKGPGDDCAVIKFSKDRYMLLSCDMIVEGVDFLRGDNPYLIGHKALAVSISDIAACGGLPQYAVVSMAMPKKTSLLRADRVTKGIFDLARKYKVNIVGGDLSCADKLIIDISITGFVEKKSLVLRSGAKKGDIIFVSGGLGGSCRGKHLSFTPRLKEARYLVNKYKINAMIDISDGLCQDLGHILLSSRAGAILYEKLIPFSKSAKGLQDALYSGEDFELLFTAGHAQAKDIISNTTMPFMPIGEIVDRKYGLRIIDDKGGETKPDKQGFQHF